VSQAASTIRFRAELLRPAVRGRGGDWSFVLVPKGAGAKLPTRGRTTVEGTLGGRAFRATLEPDGQRSHWLKVSRKLREAAGVEVGEMVEVEMLPVAEEPEARVPADLRRALAAAPEARAAWVGLTPIARRDWIHWMTSAKRLETRARRVASACEMLAAGKRRVCCFDRSGFYSRSFRAPDRAG
jgi:hypothetical protein